VVASCEAPVSVLASVVTGAAADDSPVVGVAACAAAAATAAFSAIVLCFVCLWIFNLQNTTKKTTRKRNIITHNGLPDEKKFHRFSQ
jgi:hypothetical protein